ncbi:hypothetical protein Tco_0420709 [Tanacetum coccineum]
MMMVVCYDDGEDGGGGSGVVEVARGASGIVDRVDPEVGSIFGVGRKSPPEKFSGGGEWWPAAGELAGEDEWERESRAKLKSYTPDYTPTSPDYFPVSPGNTSSDLSKYLLALLTISHFHDDPYMKVMQAYNATSNESLIPPQAPIAPPTVLHPSPVLPLSPMFDPQDFFLPEEIFTTLETSSFPIILLY